MTPLFGFPVRSDDGTLSGGSWASGMGLSNLQDARLATLARSTDATKANTQFDCDLGANKKIRAVSLHNHNLTLAAQVRIRGSTVSDFSSTVYNSGWFNAYPTAYPASTTLWGDDVSSSQISQDTLDSGYPSAVIDVFAEADARYWRIEFDDTANGDGYVELGRLIICQAYEASIGFSTGVQLGWETSSTSVEMESGAFHHKDRASRRYVNFEFSDIAQAEALVNLFEASRRMGTHSQFLFVWDKDDTIHMHRRAFLATLRELSAIEFPYVSSHNNAAFAAVEEL